MFILQNSVTSFTGIINQNSYILIRTKMKVIHTMIKDRLGPQGDRPRERILIWFFTVRICIYSWSTNPVKKVKLTYIHSLKSSSVISMYERNTCLREEKCLVEIDVSIPNCNPHETGSRACVCKKVHVMFWQMRTSIGYPIKDACLLELKIFLTYSVIIRKIKLIEYLPKTF